MRVVFLSLGWFFVAVGIAGIFIPLLPTFDFLLLATFCFARSSPRLESWLMNHPRFGEGLRAWQRERSISLASKIYAVVFVAVSFGIVIAFVNIAAWAKLSLAVLGILLIAYIASRPTRVLRRERI